MMSRQSRAIALPCLLCLGVTICALKCTNTSVAADDEDTGGATIEVVAVDAVVVHENHQAAAGAHVYVRPPDHVPDTALFHQKPSPDAVTRHDGTFALDSLPPGPYRVEVAYTNQHSQQTAASAIIRVGADGTVLAPDTLMLAQAAVIQGDIVFSDTDTIAYLHLVGTPYGAAIEPSTPAYRFAPLAEADYVLRASTALGTYGSHAYPATVRAGMSMQQKVHFSLAASENYTSWANSRLLSIDTTTVQAIVDDTLRAFPLLITLTEATFPFDQARPDGADIRFASQSGTALPYAIEHWDTDRGLAAVWVLVDTITAKQPWQAVTMFWNRPEAADRSDPATVFGHTSAFEAVWQLSEQGMGLDDEYRDRTRGAHHARGGAGEAHQVPRLVDGRSGRAQCFDGRNDLISAAHAPGLLPSGPFTVSAWVCMERLCGDSLNRQVIIRKRHDTAPWYAYELSQRRSNGVEGFAFRYVDNTQAYYQAFSAADTGIVPHQWYHVAALYDGAAVRIVINGSSSAPMAVDGSLYPATGSLVVGASHENGSQAAARIDEVRLCHRARTDAWLRLCYENQRPHSRLLNR